MRVYFTLTSGIIFSGHFKVDRNIDRCRERMTKLGVLSVRDFGGSSEWRRVVSKNISDDSFSIVTESMWVPNVAGNLTSLSDTETLVNVRVKHYAGTISILVIILIVGLFGFLFFDSIPLGCTLAVSIFYLIMFLTLTYNSYKVIKEDLKLFLVK